MKTVLFIALTICGTMLCADEPQLDLKSKKAKAALEKYNEATRKIKKLEKRSRNDLVRTLEAALKYERTEGDLDEAVKIRDAIKAIQDNPNANVGTVKPDGKGLWRKRDLLHAHMSGKTFPTPRGKLTLNADGSVSVNGAGWGEWMPMNDYDIYLRLERDQIVIIACRGLTDAANIIRGSWPYQYYEVARGFPVNGIPIKPVK